MAHGGELLPGNEPDPEQMFRDTMRSTHQLHQQAMGRRMEQRWQLHRQSQGILGSVALHELDLPATASPGNSSAAPAQENPYHIGALRQEVAAVFDAEHSDGPLRFHRLTAGALDLKVVMADPDRIRVMRFPADDSQPMPLDLIEDTSGNALGDARPWLRHDPILHGELLADIEAGLQAVQGYLIEDLGDELQ